MPDRLRNFGHRRKFVVQIVAEQIGRFGNET